MKASDYTFLKFEDEIKSFRLHGNAHHLIRLGNEFLVYLELRGLSVATVRAYGFDLVALFRWCVTSDTKLSQLTQKSFLSFIGAQTKLGLSPRSINRRISTSSLFYHFVFGQYPQWQSNAFPTRFNKGRRRFKNRSLTLRIKTPKRVIEPLGPEQIKQFTQNVSRYRDLAILSLMLFCGLRSAEVRSLTLNDIDYRQKTFRIVGKGNKERVLPLGDDLSLLIQKYIQFERPTAIGVKNLFVVLQGLRQGQPMTPAGFRSLFRYRRRISNVQAANPHRFRHTFGVEMVRAGVKIATLQKMMGHANIETTVRYLNLSMKDIAEEYQKAILVIGTRYQSLHG